MPKRRMDCRIKSGNDESGCRGPVVAVRKNGVASHTLWVRHPLLVGITIKLPAAVADDDRGRLEPNDRLRRLKTMQFFFYEIVARIVALYLFVDTIRELRRGLAERKIRWIKPSLTSWRESVVDRDTSPIQYWVQIGVRIIVLAGCLTILILGWSHPNASSIVTTGPDPVVHAETPNGLPDQVRQ
jgi:hypothetical protein